jgi:zinc protease
MATQLYSLPNSRNVTRASLDNGITILVYENEAVPAVVVEGALNAGSIYESPAKSGLASMTARMLTRGTQTRDFDAIHTALEDMAASLNVSAGVQKSSFYAKSLAEDFPAVVDLLADTLRNPGFPADHAERQRGELMTSLKLNQQDTRYRAGRAFRENLYPAEHPYHYDNRGTLETAALLTVEDMQAFHQQYYGPSGMIFVVVGAIKAQAAVEIIRAQFGDWRNDAQPAPTTLPPVFQPEEARRVFVNVPGKTQADIVLGVAGPSRYDEDYMAATLVNSVLGQFGMMGRIGNIVREKMGLAYYASSRVEGGHGPGAWLVSAGVNPANVDRAIEAIIDQIRRITGEPVSDDDLADTQSYYTGHLPLQLESNDGIAGTLLNMETFDLGLDYLVNYREMIYRHTKDDLLAAARRYLNPDALVISVAGTV